MEVVKLFQELNQRSLAEWIVHTSLERECWSELLQILHPFLCHRGWYQITFVKHEDEMLGWTIPLKMLLE